MRVVYHLEAISGMSVMGLRETERMLTDIRSGRITALIFSKLARLARSDFMRIQSGAREEILAGAKDLFSRWPKLQPEEKREIVEAIVEKVVIGKNDVVVKLYYAQTI